MKSILKIFFAIILIALIVYFPKIHNVYRTLHFFDADIIVENFTTMEETWNTSDVHRGEHARPFPESIDFRLPESFQSDEEVFDVQTFLDSSFTTGLTIIHRDTMRFEQYYLGNTRETRHISWSMAKSFVSALFGIAMEEGYITSLDQRVEEYVPELVGSGYEGVKIKDVLQMSTGVKFNEDYGDLRSDINRWGRHFAWGSSQDDFAASLVNEIPPGTLNHYVSINTHVLGMIIVRATGKSLTEYLEEKIWKKTGMEYDAYWLVDDSGMEVALCGLNVTLRDYAKMGQLYLNGGKWEGEQVVPTQWVQSSVTPDAPHVMPSMTVGGKYGFGYGYQWWIPQSDEGEYMAMGVYNQYIYVNPTKEVVIVKNSANHKYNDKSVPYSRNPVHLELFRAIAENLE